MSIKHDYGFGDHGQRYEVRMTGWPTSGESPTLYTNDLAVAERNVDTFMKAPSATHGAVIDRQDGNLPVYTVRKTDVAE